MRTLLVLLCGAGMLSAQNPAQQNPPPAQANPGQDDGFRIVVPVKTVLVPVTVQTRDGDSIPGLTPYDFKLFDNGKLQKISEDIAVHPLSVVVVIQANSDVEKILPSIKTLSSIFENLVIGDDGEMAVVAFDHRIQVLTDFTSDAPQIDAAFRRLTIGSTTAALNDATMRAVNMLKTRPATRRRIVIQIAENRDKGSEIRKVREILTEAEFANVTFYSVNISQLLAALTSKAQPNRPDPIQSIPGAQGGLPLGTVNTVNTPTQNDFGNFVPAMKDVFDAVKGIFVPDPLDVYTRYSGGREYGFKNVKELQSDVQKIGDELHSQYLLSYTPNNQNEAGFHQIAVQVMKPGLVIRARDGYWLAGKPE
jgi:VWFA-related protein